MSKRMATIIVVLAMAIVALWVVQLRRAAKDLDAELWEYLHLGFANGVVTALENGADATSTNEFGHPTTLYGAAIADPQPMQMLIDGGALANDKWSELDVYCSVTRIKPFGGKAGDRDAKSWMMQGTPTTPLAIAAKHGNFQTALVLLEAGAEIRPWDHTAESVVHLAVLGQSTQLVLELTDRSAEVTEDDLMIACILSDIEMLKTILTFDVDVNAVNTLDSTSLEIAWRRNERDDDDRMLRMLLTNGAIPATWMLESANRSSNLEMLSLLQQSIERNGQAEVQ